MSLEKHFEANFEGAPPRFLPAIDMLNDVYTNVSVNGFDLGRIFARVEGYQNRTEIETSDGYHWFWAGHFVWDWRCVVVALPSAQDWERQDDSGLDRSVAVYTHESLTDEELGVLLLKIIEFFWVHRRKPKPKRNEAS